MDIQFPRLLQIGRDSQLSGEKVTTMHLSKLLWLPASQKRTSAMVHFSLVIGRQGRLFEALALSQDGHLFWMSVIVFCGCYRVDTLPLRLRMDNSQCLWRKKHITWCRTVVQARKSIPILFSCWRAFVSSIKTISAKHFSVANMSKKLDMLCHVKKFLESVWILAINFFSGCF